MPFNTAAVGPHTVSTVKTSGGIDLYYELHGNGKNKILFITGLSASCTAWEVTVAALLPSKLQNGTTTDDYEICLFDNRGVGDSTMDVPAGYKIKDMAQDALDLLNHLGWTKDVFLGGVSMGGMISLELLLLAPKGTFASAALISTHAGRTIPPLKNAFSLLSILFKKGKIPDSERVRLLIQLIFSPTWLALPPTEEDIDMFHRQIVGQNHPETAEWEPTELKTNLDLIASVLTRHGLTKPAQTDIARKGQVSAINFHYVSKDRLGKIKESGIPILVVTGTDDPLVRPKNSTHISHYTGGKLIVYPNKGHALGFEANKAFHADLDRHYRSASAFQTASEPAATKATPCANAIASAIENAKAFVEKKAEEEKTAVVTEVAEEAVVEKTLEEVKEEMRALSRLDTEATEVDASATVEATKETVVASVTTAA
ncbi:hypothetical protein HDU97_006463 [Phlyctochytrium planicorne]|nr:hypothetical protein HDU97_006463 [Phlyctochytrium planicorne]